MSRGLQFQEPYIHLLVDIILALFFPVRFRSFIENSWRIELQNAKCTYTLKKKKYSQHKCIMLNKKKDPYSWKHALCFFAVPTNENAKEDILILFIH